MLLLMNDFLTVIVYVTAMYKIWIRYWKQNTHSTDIMKFLYNVEWKETACANVLPYDILFWNNILLIYILINNQIGSIYWFISPQDNSSLTIPPWQFLPGQFSSEQLRPDNYIFPGQFVLGQLIPSTGHFLLRHSLRTRTIFFTFFCRSRACNSA
jgi:hypothetical protein